jgi:hypothetical protein
MAEKALFVGVFLVVGSIFGFGVGHYTAWTSAPDNPLCKAVVCEQGLKGRYLDGKCYEADGLREVKP